MRKKAGKQRLQEKSQIQKPKRERKNRQHEVSPGFREEYCPMLVDHCSKGLSFQSFAAIINVLPEMLDEWTEKYPEFAKARTIAALKLKIYWETMAVKACTKKFSFSIFRYFTKSDKDEKPPSASGAVVLIPTEDPSK